MKTEISYFGLFTNFCNRPSYMHFLKCYGLSFVAFWGITCIRWVIKANTKNEFDTYPPERMIEICKFC